MLCWWRGMCFVEEYTSAPLGSSRFMYSGDVSRAIVPVSLVLIFIVFPGAFLSVRLQLPWMLGTSWVLMSLSSAFFAIVSAATFALLGNGGISSASDSFWNKFPLATRTLSYGGDQENLTREMKGDAAAIAVATLAGAVATGLCAVALSPFARLVFWALHMALKGWWAERYGGSAPMGVVEGAEDTPPAVTKRPLDLHTLCCALPLESSIHDAGGDPIRMAASDAGGGEGEGSVSSTREFTFCGCSVKWSAPKNGNYLAAFFSCLFYPFSCLARGNAGRASDALLDLAGLCGPWFRALVGCALRGAPRRGILGDTVNEPRNTGKNIPAKSSGKDGEGTGNSTSGAAETDSGAAKTSEGAAAPPLGKGTGETSSGGETTEPIAGASKEGDVETGKGKVDGEQKTE